MKRLLLIAALALAPLTASASSTPAPAPGLSGPSSTNMGYLGLGAVVTAALEFGLPSKWSPNTRTAVSLASSLAAAFAVEALSVNGTGRTCDNGDILAAGMGSVAMLQFKF